MNDSSPRPDEKSGTKKPGTPGVGTPFAGESSSSNDAIPPQDEDQATLVDAGPSRHDPDATIIDVRPLDVRPVDARPVAAKPLDPEATLVDVDATIAPGTSFRRMPPPSPSSFGRSSAAADSAAVLQIGDLLAGRY